MIRSIVDDRMLTIYLLISEDFFLLFKSDQFEMMAKLTKSKSKDDRIVVPCFWSLTSPCLEFQVSVVLIFVFSVLGGCSRCTCARIISVGASNWIVLSISHQIIQGVFYTGPPLNS